MRKVNESLTVHRESGCGTLHLTMEYNEGYEPIRITILLGKAGGCSSCQLQALQGALNERLTQNQPIDYIYDKKNDNSWIGIRCPQIQHEEEQVELEDERINLSCPDVIAKTIRYALKKLEEWKKETKKK